MHLARGLYGKQPVAERTGEVLRFQVVCHDVSLALSPRRRFKLANFALNALDAGYQQKIILGDIWKSERKRLITSSEAGAFPDPSPSVLARSV